VGISFYTFQTMSYTIDVYRRELPAERDLLAYMAYVSFFPQLVAGPIERARTLLAQFNGPRSFDAPAAADGLRQILWGLCKKVLVADSCGRYVQAVYADPAGHGAHSAGLAALLTVVQIYGDFSGYSDIAVGTARLFGIRLMRNFRYPLFATTVPDFWRRWHISLMGWFRDYVYRPLGGGKLGRARHLRNLAAIFLLSAFWHGAQWTFVWWGIYSFVTFLPQERVGARDPSWRTLPHIALTLLVISLGAVLFRARDLAHAAAFYSRLLDWDMALRPLPWATVIPLAVMLALEWRGRDDAHALERLLRPGPRWARWGLYYGLIASFIILGERVGRSYVYFRF
jgi:D-alanyl-lipoteichoic acid acyltransferase DltB (MBOAT superfamily)